MKLMYMHFSTPLGRTISNKLAANIDCQRDNYRHTEVSDTHSAGVLKKLLLGFTWTCLVFCKQQGCLERNSCAAATRLGLYHVLSNVIASFCLLGALCATCNSHAGHSSISQDHDKFYLKVVYGGPAMISNAGAFIFIRRHDP